jgi:hypothetical protein
MTSTTTARQPLPGFKLPPKSVVPSTGSAAVLEALAKQVGCYQRLAKLAELQHQHVEREQVEGLIEVLQLRGEVLSEVAALETIVGPAKKSWTTFLGTLPPERRASAQAMLADTRRLLEQITSADKDDVLVLQQRKLSLGRQITQAGTARTINRNYAASAYGKPPVRVDVSR